ncbi:MAG: TIGR02587 family membrane protein, partial [Pseudomonadota bacterium]|nr:TIGR02587 family membrane protein [Pseudomonadota bacterium]
MGLARAFGGAILFSFPMLMTMEMWWLGFYMDPLRLALFILLDIPLLVGLSYYAGFEPTSQRLADVMDAFTAYAVGFTAAGLLLVLFAIIEPGMSADEIIGKIAVQAVPASIGAMLARSQFGEHLWFVFLRFTIVGYATALLISVFILWTFGRTDGLTVGQIIQATVVLGFPAALGAGAARLIL